MDNAPKTFGIDLEDYTAARYAIDGFSEDADGLRASTDYGFGKRYIDTKQVERARAIIEKATLPIGRAAHTLVKLFHRTK